MIKYLSIMAMLAILPLSNAAAQQADSAAVIGTLCKCWRTISHVYSPIYGLEEKERKVYAKQRLCFSRDSISLYFGVTYSPKYTVKRVASEDYARTNFDCSRQKLDITTDSVYQVVISSVTKPNKDGKVFKTTDMLAFDGYCIYVALDGVIFKLFDANAKVEGRSSN